MKKILNAESLLNKIFSSTQRKTPTLVHKRYSIERIRKFYIRKIKFVQQNFVKQISDIIDSFPSIDYIHPFFGKLLSLMFQRQHYKMALYRLSKSKLIIDIICKNFIKLVKNGNSLYICKQLKKEALGRMCTVIKKLTKPLVFLEKVRMHIEKLPEIDPHRKSVILCGCPKVGKSSYLNKTTRANVKVGNLGINNNLILTGHMQFNFSRLQILDTIGVTKKIIQHPNSFGVQMYSIFLDLDCTVLHFFDFSEICSTTLSNQINVFKILNNINPYVEKMLILTKMDLGWEKFMNQLKKAGLNFLQKNFQQFSNVFKTSFHDEIGMYMIKQLQRKIVFKSTFKGEIQSQQEKLKFPKPNNLKNILNYYKAPKNFDSKDDREKRSLDSKVPPEQDTCFGEKNEKPTCLANLYDLTIIEHWRYY